MKRKFVIAMMMHETNTFSPIPTPLEAFTIGGPLVGPSVIPSFERTNTALGGFIDMVRELDADFVVPLAAEANPSGPVTDDAFDEMADAIIRTIGKGCDAVLLALHGAMITETYDDGEGELLRRIRAAAPETPIAVSLDFHAHMTKAMVSAATVIAGYRTYPHLDMADSSRRAGRTLMRLLEGKVDPIMVWGRIPLMSSTLVHSPRDEPMKTLMNLANEAEDTGRVLNASVFGGFPHADIPHLGLSSVIVCDRQTEEGERLLAQILDHGWRERQGFRYQPEPLAVQIARAKSFEGGPVIIADHGDNTYSGGTQDVMSVVEEAIRQGLDDVCVGPIWDPASVQGMIEAGVGAKVTIDLGGKTDMPAIGLKGKPLRLTGRVRCITDGTFVVTCPMSTGTTVRMGRTAVLDTGEMQFVISEERSEAFDLGVFTHCGIDPRQKSYVLIKSRQHFRAGFESIAKHIVLCDGDGCTSSDLSRFQYSRISRPLYPFDSELHAGAQQ